MTNVPVISDACGKMMLIYEFSNPITRTYRLKLRDSDPNEEVCSDIKDSTFIEFPF